MADSPGIKRLRSLVRRREEVSGQIDEAVAELLRDGEFVEDIADALGTSRETVRRTRDRLGIADAREIRRAKGLPTRRQAG
jgi:DNA-binding NarL/FixJ family response regulator